MKKIVLIVLVLVSIVSAANGGEGYFSFGMQNLDISSVNDRMEKLGFAKFSENVITLGGGGHTMIHDFIIGGEGHGMLDDNSSKSGYSSNITGGYGFFNFGYNFISGKNYNIYSILGIGGGGLEFTVTEKGDHSFDDYVTGNNRSTSFETGGFLLNLSAGAEYKVSSWILGIRGGYIMTPIEEDWKFGDIEADNGPDTGLNGFYLRLSFGGGGYIN